MSASRGLMWGSVPVPYVASWTSETRFFLAVCPYIQCLAVCQDVSPGVGKPVFGSPHMNRQRESIALDLCDTCGMSLATRTKVSLSHARPQPHAHQAGDILQVEPLLHRACTAVSVQHCPSLKRDVASGAINIRQVFGHRSQYARLHIAGIREMIPDAPDSAHGAIGHAKVQLIKWRDRDLAWLTRHSDRVAA